MGNGQYCYPLTMTNYHSRYLLACEALESTKESFAFSGFECFDLEAGRVEPLDNPFNPKLSPM